MKKIFIQHAVIFGAVMTAVPAAWATDVGTPLYQGDIAEKKSSIEVYYEKYTQNVTFDSKEFSIPNQDFDYEGTFSGEQEEDRIIVRMNYYAGPRFAFYAEVGATDSLDSKEKAPIFGAGLRSKLFSSSFFDVSPFVSMTYIPEIDYVLYYPQSSIGDQTIFQQESYFGINGGLTFSKLLHLSNTCKWMPYGGLMVSKIFGDHDVDAILQNGQERSLLLVDRSIEEEDGEFSMFAGFNFMFNDTWGLRAEGRFINQTSLSAGLSYFF